jgi:hypothetical protein
MGMHTHFRPALRMGVVALGWAALFALLAYSGAFSDAAVAQQKKKGSQPTRNVQGVVHAPDGAPQGGAVVQLENKRTMQVRSFISQADGSYYFHDLNADVDYGLRAEFRGAASDKRTVSSFDSRPDVTIDLQLKAAEPTPPRKW